MQVYRYLPRASSSRAIALAIGTFDGVHGGHQAVLSALCRTARQHHCPAVVMTFDAHPSACVRPEQVPLRLVSVAEQLSLLAAAGVDEVYLLRFTADLMTCSPENFVEDILVRRLAVKHLVVGDDFRFGAGRCGDTDFLSQYAEVFGLSVVPPVSYGTQRVSSTHIRHYLSTNRFAEAHLFLGRPFSYRGHVAYGDQRGRTIGFPTMNVPMTRHHRPCLSGVFVTAVRGLSPQPLPAVSNIGWRPTVDKRPRLILETHVFDFDDDVYGQLIHVDFFYQLRAEQRFSSLSALEEAIRVDSHCARAYHACRSLMT